MGRFVALLRAINLGSHNKVAMADLRACFETAGMRDVTTIVLSGNVAFSTDATSTAKLEATLEAAAARHLGIQTPFLVRSAKEWQAIITANPFPEAAKEDPGHLLMMALRQAPDRAAVAALQAAIKGREQVHAVGREAYFVYPDGVGTSKLTIAVIEKKLGTTGTARNWNTVLKLGALVG